MFFVEGWCTRRLRAIDYPILIQWTSKSSKSPKGSSDHKLPGSTSHEPRYVTWCINPSISTHHKSYVVIEYLLWWPIHLPGVLYLGITSNELFIPHFSATRAISPPPGPPQSHFAPTCIPASAARNAADFCRKTSHECGTTFSRTVPGRHNFHGAPQQSTGSPLGFANGLVHLVHWSC